MSQKIAPGAWREGGPPGGGEAEDAKLEEKKARLRKKRDSSTWYVAVGIALLFSAGLILRFAVGLLVGGIVMVVFGAASYIYYSRRIRRLDDPWDDPEIDAWEQEMIRNGGAAPDKDDEDLSDQRWRDF